MTTADYLRTIQNFVWEYGAPDAIICNHDNYHSSGRVLDYLRMLWIRLWVSEAHYQHHNALERRYQTLKRMTNCLMDRTGTPSKLLFLALNYFMSMFLIIHLMRPSTTYNLLLLPPTKFATSVPYFNLHGWNQFSSS